MLGEPVQQALRPSKNKKARALIIDPPAAPTAGGEAYTGREGGIPGQNQLKLSTEIAISLASVALPLNVAQLI
jgi:hypothetical protein